MIYTHSYLVFLHFDLKVVYLGARVSLNISNNQNFNSQDWLMGQGLEDIAEHLTFEGQQTR